MEDNMARLYGYCRKSTEKQNETSFEIKERKKILKKKRIIIFLDPVDKYNTFMVEYMCKGEKRNGKEEN